MTKRDRGGQRHQRRWDDLYSDGPIEVVEERSRVTFWVAVWTVLALLTLVAQIVLWVFG